MTAPESACRRPSMMSDMLATLTDAVGLTRLITLPDSAELTQSPAALHRLELPPQPTQHIGRGPMVVDIAVGHHPGGRCELLLSSGRAERSLDSFEDDRADRDLRALLSPDDRTAVRRQLTTMAGQRRHH